MLNNIVQFFYPDIKKEDVKKTTLLALTFLSVIGSYWLLRLLKDFVICQVAFPVSLGYSATEGLSWLPIIKIISPFFGFALVIPYMKLVDMFEKHKLFYIVTSFYAAIFAFMGILLYIQTVFGPELLGTTVLKYSGILGYLFTESFGSIVIALFWSFTISSTNTEQAKSYFPFIVAVGQIGAITGSSLMMFKGIPSWLCYIIPAIVLIFSVFTLKAFTKLSGTKTKTVNAPKKKPDFFDGIKLLFMQPYFIGILAVSTLYEVAGTIIDFTMKSQAINLGLDFSWFMGIYGVLANSLAFFLALIGTSKLMKKFGLRICILIYPVAFASALLLLYTLYISGASAINILWALFSTMLLIKAASYAVSNPVKEMMYIPTTKDAKFKVKGVIDMIGARTAKMAGSGINTSLGSMANLLAYGSLISLGVMGVMIGAAILVGAKNKKLVDNNEILGA